MRIERAREFFIKRKNPYYELGIAFHYIADKFCLPSNDPRHEEFEQQISESSITKNIDSPRVEGKRATINRALIRRSENITPNQALNLALFYGVVTIILLYLGSFSLFISLAIAIVQILWHYSSQIDKDIVENLDWYNWNAVTI